LRYFRLDRFAGSFEFIYLIYIGLALWEVGVFTVFHNYMQAGKILIFEFFSMPLLRVLEGCADNLIQRSHPSKCAPSGTNYLQEAVPAVHGLIEDRGIPPIRGKTADGWGTELLWQVKTAD
jgi:hypothetical protein